MFICLSIPTCPPYLKSEKVITSVINEVSIYHLLFKGQALPSTMKLLISGDP